MKFSHGITRVGSSSGDYMGSRSRRPIFCSVRINEFLIDISEPNTETYPNDPVLNVCTLV